MLPLSEVDRWRCGGAGPSQFDPNRSPQEIAGPNRARFHEVLMRVARFLRLRIKRLFLLDAVADIPDEFEGATRLFKAHSRPRMRYVLGKTRRWQD
jgi:hypothetical protein